MNCYESDKTISDILNDIIELDFMNVEYIDKVRQDSKYSDVMTVSISEFRALYEYLHIQNVSTQHGVKGESHNSVIFVADDSNNPSVKMNDFFKLWSQQELTLKNIESFSYSYSKMIKKVETIIGKKITAQLYKEKKDDLDQIISDFAYDNADNELFKSVCKNDWDAYNFKSNVTNFNKVVKKNRVKSLLMAYRLFYVGCSRARKNLTILVDKTKVLPFLDDLKKNLKMLASM